MRNTRFVLRRFFFALVLAIMLSSVCAGMWYPYNSLPFYSSISVDKKDSTIPLSFELNGAYGFFIANQPKSLYLRNDHSRLLELNITRQTAGNHLWEKENNYPRLGVGLLYGDLGSREFLGKVASVYPFIHFPLLKTSGSVTTFRLGAGVGWVEKPYNKNDNYKNLMIGTHINAVISMRLQSEWQLYKDVYMNAGILFTHLSNGSIRLPNLGLNIPSLSAGLRYNPASSPVTHSRHRPSAMNKNYLFINTSIAFKQTYPLESKLRLVKIINPEFSHALSAVSRLGAGVIISYDPSLSKEIANAPTYTFDQSQPQFQASIYGGYEHVAGRLSIPVQLGVYLYNQYAINQLYQLIGLRYRFAGNWVASVQLKAHFGKADYIQYGIGYKIF
jgi:hypothetical protein